LGKQVSIGVEVVVEASEVTGSLNGGREQRVVSVVGARPQFIKAAPVSRALRARGIEETLLHTGQHYDHNMSAVFFDELGIPEPDINLGVGSGLHGWQTGQMLMQIEEVLVAQRPDWVLVYGDTNSTLAGALAAVKLLIPVAHVEAGLRSFNRSMPEEHNRVLTDHASDLLFCPTKEAVRNLLQEGICQDRIELVGDVMYDAVIDCATKAEQESRILEQLSLAPQSYVLATVHRASNTDSPTRLRAIFQGLMDVAADIPVVLPLHPRTRIALEEQGLLDRASASLNLLKPVSYLDMVVLEKNAQLVATDSGGVQKEAYFHHVPCVTLRCETEWVELVESGWNRICAPVSREAVREAVLAAIDTKGTQQPHYGGGDAALRVAQSLLLRRPRGAQSGI
jgi:UDP-GlcNAc3NAcA epimerase